MAVVDRSKLLSNDQSTGQVANPDKLEDSINHLADTIDTNNNGFNNHKSASELDHPDNSVTEKKLANSSVSRRTIQEGAVGYAELDDSLINFYGDIAVKAKLDEHTQQLAQIAEVTVSITDKRFGAKGDGTDESAKMQAAVDYVSSKGGGVVIIPYGTFKGNITISTSKVNIGGVGTLKGTINLYGTSTIGVSRFSGVGDISIKGITIDGEKTRNGINLRWVFGITIEGVTFKHNLKSIYFEPVPNSQHCSRITVNANRIWDCNYGLYVDYDNTITDLVKFEVGDINYTNNVHESRNTGWDGTFGNQYHIWAKGLDGLICKGNTFFFANTGGEVTNIYLDLFNWVIIEGNQLFEAKEHGIKAINGSNLVIANNNFAWGDLEQVYLSNIVSCSIQGNNFTWGDDGGAVTARRSGIYIGQSPYFIGTVIGNTFQFPNEHAIVIEASSYVNVSSNNSLNKYSTLEPVKINFSNCVSINVSNNTFTGYSKTMTSVLTTKNSQSRIHYGGNAENDSTTLYEGVFLSKRTMTVSGTQTTLDATTYDQFNLAQTSPTTITSLSGGIEGKTVTFVAFNGNTVLSNSLGWLKGQLSVTIPNKGTLTMRYTSGSWYEISRNF